MNQFGVFGDYLGRFSTEPQPWTIRQPSIGPADATMNCCGTCQYIVRDVIGRILVVDKGSDPAEQQHLYTICGSGASSSERIINDLSSLSGIQKKFPLVPETRSLRHCYKKKKV